MISVFSPSCFDRDRLRRQYVDILMRKWRRHEFEFPEIFLLGTLRSNALEFVAIKSKICECTFGSDGIQREAI